MGNSSHHREGQVIGLDGALAASQSEPDGWLAPGLSKNLSLLPLFHTI
jgi:hypothetical protein